MTSDLDPTPNEERSARTAELSDAVGTSVVTLQAQYLGSRGERQQAQARGRLAVLRRSAGFTPEQRPLALQDVLDALDPALRQEDLGRGDAASPTERAAFDAMTMFALHMQSATEPMHVRGRSFGSAMSLLRSRSESGSLKPRFDALLAARDQRSRLTHARSLITLLRGEKIGFDYGMFARDLRTLASPHRAGVLLRWGRDFATPPRRSPGNTASDSTAISGLPASPSV